MSKPNSLLPSTCLFASLRDPSFPMHFLQATLFPCAVLLLYSQCDLASSSSLLWWPGCPPSTVLQTLYPRQERCTCGGWAPLVAYGTLYCCLLENTANTVLLALVRGTEFLIGFWLAVLMQYQKDGLFRKIAAAFAQINLYMFTISTVTSDFTAKAIRSWDMTVRTVS